MNHTNTFLCSMYIFGCINIVVPTLKADFVWLISIGTFDQSYRTTVCKW